MNKPTIEQTAWVLKHVADHLREGGTFRYLIYDRLGYDAEAYAPLFDAGGMDISNDAYELNELRRSRGNGTKDAEIDKYGYWGEHPAVSIEDWKYEVNNDDSRLGYWETVLNKLEESNGKEEDSGI